MLVRVDLNLCQADILFIGYPCTSLSSQNQNPQSIVDETSASGMGYKALQSYVDYARPSVVFAENVQRQSQLCMRDGAKECVAGRLKISSFVKEKNPQRASILAVIVCSTEAIEMQNRDFRAKGYLAFSHVVNTTHPALLNA